MHIEALNFGITNFNNFLYSLLTSIHLMRGMTWFKLASIVIFLLHINFKKKYLFLNIEL